MWPETLDAWYAQGLTQAYRQAGPADWGALVSDETQRILVHEFGFDRVDYLRAFAASGYTDTPFVPLFESYVKEDDGDTRLVVGVDGITYREFVRNPLSSMPGYVRFPVQTRKDFLALLPRLNPSSPARFGADWPSVCTAYAQRDFPVGMTVCGAFGHPRNLMGVEALCVAYYDQPGLIHEILDHWTEFYSQLSSRIWRDLPFDFLLIWEDMAYKNGPLISPRLVKEFMLPYYRRLIDHVRALGCEVIIVDSDGDVELLVPLFLSVGVNVMLPFEVQAGMDIRRFRQRYGKNLALYGGLDKRALCGGPAAIETELHERMLPVLAGGGYFPALDHTAPPDISLSAFRYYLQRLRELASNPA